MSSSHGGMASAAAPAGIAGGLTAETITAPAELNALAGEWNELLTASRADTVFLTWEWVSAWLDTVGARAPLLVVAVREADGRLAGLAPFYRLPMRLLGAVPYRGLRVIGDVHSGAEYPDFILRRGLEERVMPLVMQALLACHGAWDCLWIPRVAGWTGAPQRLEQACRRLGLHCRQRPAPFACTPLPGSHEEYFMSLSKGLRATIRRCARQLEQGGPLELVRCQSEQELPEMLDELFRRHRQRWESIGQSGSFIRRPPMAAFYRRFAPAALRQGWLRLYALRVGSQVQAVQFGYAYGGAFHQMQEGFNPTLPDVGNVLRDLVVKACIEEGLREYDFLGGYTDHKRHWRAEMRTGCDLFIGRRCLKNRLLFHRPLWPTGRFIRQGSPVDLGPLAADRPVTGTDARAATKKPA